MKINEVVIDNEHGAGNTPNNQEVDYLGFRVLMKPSVFLKLAEYIPRYTDKADRMRQFVKQGNPIASPFLKIEIPDEWNKGDYSKPAQVGGHEGRHRMMGVLYADGDEPIEVHLFFYSYNKRRIPPEWLSQIDQILVSQDGDTLKGPFFKLIS